MHVDSLEALTELDVSWAPSLAQLILGPCMLHRRIGNGSSDVPSKHVIARSRPHMGSSMSNDAPRGPESDSISRSRGAHACPTAVRCTVALSRS